MSINLDNLEEFSGSQEADYKSWTADDKLMYMTHFNTLYYSLEDSYARIINQPIDHVGGKPHLKKFVNHLIYTYGTQIETDIVPLIKSLNFYDLEMMLIQDASLVFEKMTMKNGKALVVGKELKLKNAPEPKFTNDDVKPCGKSAASKSTASKYGRRASAAKCTKRKSVPKARCLPEDDDIREMLADNEEALMAWKAFARKYKKGQL
jgi:hypothetical protein